MFEKPQGKDGKSLLPDKNFSGKLSTPYFEAGINEV